MRPSPFLLPGRVSSMTFPFQTTLCGDKTGSQHGILLLKMIQEAFPPGTPSAACTKSFIYRGPNLYNHDSISRGVLR